MNLAAQGTVFNCLGTEVRVDAALAGRVRAVWDRGSLPGAFGVDVMPDRLAPDTEQPSGPLDVQTSQGTLRLERGGDLYRAGRVSFRVRAQGAQLWFPATPDHTEALAEHLAMTEALRAAGLLPLHAAVLTRQGRTLALTGPSGAGKSTATLRLLLQGWQVVAEDYAWIHPGTRQIRGWDDGLRLHAHSVTTFAPHWVGQHTGRDQHGKWTFPVPRVPGGVLDELVVLGAPETLSATEQVRALWETTGTPVSQAARTLVAGGVTALLRALKIRGADRDTLIHSLRSG